ncbi:MAG: alanine/ornithine racemase family PLP-dependent enzyme [Bacillota bacterium]
MPNGYPRLEVRLEAVRHNARHVVELCGALGIEVMGVTKGVCAWEPVARCLAEAGVVKLGDSRIRNLQRLRKAAPNIPLYLIRIPMPSEVDQVVAYADGSFHSELTVLRLLSEKAVAAGKRHKVILMVDVGDLREGVMPEDVLSAVAQIVGLPGIEFEGLGTNVGCYGGVLPSRENTSILVELAHDITKELGVNVTTISGGNTATLALIERGELPVGITQLRVGEAILLGTDTTGSRQVSGTVQDTMVLKAQVIEVKVKPSVPKGTLGKDAFGRTPVFEDKGPMRRAIVALGRQDCNVEGLVPLDSRIRVLGASSDHLLLDVTAVPEQELGVGSVVEFRPTYGAMLGLMTSPYVEKTCARGCSPTVFTTKVSQQ